MRKIDAIERCSETEYRVLITLEDRPANFLFHVDQRDGIDVVTWEKDFETLMWRTVATVQPILAAVLALHQAQTCLSHLEIPSDSG